MSESTMEHNVDRPGPHYTEARKTVHELCKLQCDRDARCRCWTFLGSTCFLKEKVFDRVRQPGAISGAKLVGLLDEGGRGKPLMGWNHLKEEEEEEEEEEVSASAVVEAAAVKAVGYSGKPALREDTEEEEEEESSGSSESSESRAPPATGRDKGQLAVGSPLPTFLQLAVARIPQSTES